MLLYAAYIPVKITSWDHECVFAFASVERLIAGLRLVNEMGERKGTLRPITHEEAMEMSGFATLFTVSDKSSDFRKGELINIRENGIRDSWDGRWREIQLVEKIEDERVPTSTVYA